jgi:hemoglobin-like flavoprotein
MTPEQIHLVRNSFDALWPLRRKLAETFYQRFFELAPGSRRLFPDDMERQQLKLMDSLAAIVGALDRREIFQAVISHSARQHVQFGAAAARTRASLDHIIRRSAEQDDGWGSGDGLIEYQVTAPSTHQQGGT